MIKIAVLCLASMGLMACSPKPSDQTTEHRQNIEHRQNTDKSLKVLTPDWGIAAELAGMNHPPIATGDVRVYEDWMGQTLPSTTHDLGIRYQPNPEMMAGLEIDLVVDNFFYEHIRSMYGDVPVKSVLLKDETTAAKADTASKDKPTSGEQDKNKHDHNKHNNNKKATWQGYADKTYKLGQIINEPKDANAYIKHSEQNLKQLGALFKKKYPHIRKLAIVQFADVANLRMYANNSFYQPALDKMGLELVAFAEGSKWGFVNIQLGELDKLAKNNPAAGELTQANRIKHDTCLIIVKPFSPMLQDELNNSALWQKMGFGSTGQNGRCMTVIEPVWMYGGIASMNSFAEHLMQAKLYGGAYGDVDKNASSNFSSNVAVNIASTAHHKVYNNTLFNHKPNKGGDNVRKS